MDQENIRPAASLESQRGFTLIELSIVLVIIGLIIGGVLQGQEMINSARLKGQVAQADATRAATQSFQDKYNALPGDFLTATAANVLGATVGGDGDGFIAGAATAVAANGAIDAEMTAAVDHLRLGGYLASVQGAGATAQLPGKFDRTLVFPGFFTQPDGQNRHAVRVQGGTGAIPAAGLRTSDSFSMDTKYDDGNPVTGTVQAIDFSGANNCINAAGNAYSVTAGVVDGLYCGLLVRIN